MTVGKMRLDGRKIGLASLVMVAAFVATTVASTLSAYAASTSDFKGMLISPATQRLSLKNGQSYTGSMNVSNRSDNKNMTIKMSVGTYTITDNNYSSPSYNSESKYSLMKDWIKLDKTSFVLKPGEDTNVKYTINTPVNPPSGMQYATILASLEPEKADTGISATAQVGMIVMATMADGKTVDKAIIQNENIDGYQPTSPLKSTFSIKNEGNIGADVTYQMIVNSAINGKKVYESKAASNSVYPETSRSFTINWDNVGIGFYNVEQKITVNGRTHSIKKMVCTVPVWIILLIIIAIVALVGYFVVTYRMRQEARGKVSSKKKTATKRSSKK